jgi:hypothetical protein
VLSYKTKQKEEFQGTKYNNNDILVVETRAGGSPCEKPIGEKEGEQ